mmetsp:Transcript_50501/g.143195  ORF Transcript_50501/g.143195 Transcript_50501/m.143195 type:complete len:171 (+) Transcript_50501:128-640(+)
MSVVCRINWSGGNIDVVPRARDSSPRVRSAPDVVDRASSSKRTTYVKLLQISQVRAPDPSVGSRGHADGLCAGFCRLFKERPSCTYGTACVKCHVRNCTNPGEGQRARRRRQASQGPVTGDMAGAASSSSGVKVPRLEDLAGGQTASLMATDVGEKPGDAKPEGFDDRMD